LPAVPVILPPRLNELLIRLSDARMHPVAVLGAATPHESGRSDHPLQTWIEGRYAGRDLRLRKCAGCEAVEVRDISFDQVIGSARYGPRRIDALLGFYTGNRPRGREFMGSIGSVGSRRA
jgi:hypothetical protein